MLLIEGPKAGVHLGGLGTADGRLHRGFKVNDVNVTDQLPPGVEDNHIHLTDDDAVFAPKFERLLKEK